MHQKIRSVFKCVGILVIATMVTLAGVYHVRPVPVNAEGCVDLRIIFARGSGGERWEDKNYLEFKSTIEQKLKSVDLSYEFIDLDYPAIGVGLDNLGVTAGAFLAPVKHTNLAKV